MFGLESHKDGERSHINAFGCPMKCPFLEQCYIDLITIPKARDEKGRASMANGKEMVRVDSWMRCDTQSEV